MHIQRLIEKRLCHMDFAWCCRWDPLLFPVFLKKLWGVELGEKIKMKSCIRPISSQAFIPVIHLELTDFRKNCVSDICKPWLSPCLISHWALGNCRIKPHVVPRWIFNFTYRHTLLSFIAPQYGNDFCHSGSYETNITVLWWKCLHLLTYPSMPFFLLELYSGVQLDCSVGVYNNWNCKLDAWKTVFYSASCGQQFQLQHNSSQFMQTYHDMLSLCGSCSLQPESEHLPPSHATANSLHFCHQRI